MQEDIQKWKSRIEEQRKLDKNKYETKEEKRKNIFTLRFEKKLNKAIKNSNFPMSLDIENFWDLGPDNHKIIMLELCTKYNLKSKYDSYRTKYYVEPK